MLSLFNFPNNLKTLVNAIPEDSSEEGFINEFLEYIMQFKSLDKSSLAKTLKLSEEQIEHLLNGEQTIDKKIMTRIKYLFESEAAS